MILLKSKPFVIEEIMFSDKTVQLSADKSFKKTNYILKVVR